MSSISLERAQREMDAKTKPLGALGRLEDVGTRLAVLQGTLRPTIDNARVCVFGADHGVTDEGVSAYPRAVTGEMMKNFDRRGAAINVIATALNVGVEVIDVGVDADLASLASIRHERVRAGSRNMVVEPAMTADELNAALAVGRAAAERAKRDGMAAIGLGEMGIGNTTAAAAILAALSKAPVERTVGRGTGVDDAGLARKRSAVERALARHEAALTTSSLEVLRCVGGLEIAAMAGAALAGASLGLVVVADGFISSTAILVALHIAREQSATDAAALAAALFFSHCSAEAGHRLVLEECGRFDACDAAPLLDLGMRLGEGTGSALAMPLLRAAAAVMREMATFESAGVSAGEHATEHTVEHAMESGR